MLEKIDGDKRLLLVSYYCPSKCHAGGLRVLDLYVLLRSIYKTAMIDLYTIKRPEIDGSYSDLEDAFDEVVFSKNKCLSLDEFIELKGGKVHYDIVDFQFHEAALDIDNFKKIAKKILFTPMELLLRSLLLEFKRAAYNPSTLKKSTLCSFSKMGLMEIKLARKVDATVCVSTGDARVLKLLSFASGIVELETGLSYYEFAAELAINYVPISVEKKENTVLYLAYFGSQTNIDALVWYLENVHPVVKKEVPNYKFMIVGRGDMTAFKKYQDDNIKFVGEVDMLSPIISTAKVGIAPALGGSGFRGKVNQYAICGVPCVASPVAASSLAYRDGVDIFIEESSEKFASRCVLLLRDKGENERMSQSARNTCIQHYTWKSKEEEVRKIYNLLNEDI